MVKSKGAINTLVNTVRSKHFVFQKLVKKKKMRMKVLRLLVRQGLWTGVSWVNCKTRSERGSKVKRGKSGKGKLFKRKRKTSQAISMRKEKV